ncbi:UNVERIFIED_ORG: hypothetical protein B2H98_16885 [Clostridium botulinum]|uniref:DUF5685 family protein n=1 Tax=Clostridium botulinum TaxID=1491 RepID=UPI0007738E9E|nr:DUF5685 family protein [Clostridium botulinum]MBN1059436.1 hypothetical protein [Clostridium botulinum]MBN1071946.1 hypothetical protein [Clostridium botulinum]NFH80122.1 hypothetical protein [Clostridium botulinum]NFH81985.1 hypothetical protein [Clostridium botulinum]NFI09959.1 hypothetical protein [Clostridium botulinum]
MFGYVTPLKNELKVKDFNLFRAYYCGLCHEIKKNFGNIPRLTLNYDMTFLAILLDSLNDITLNINEIRCLFHPIYKRNIISNNDAISYASFVNISLTYYKLIDDANDDLSLKSKLESLFLSQYKRKFSKSIASINIEIKKNLLKLNSLEKNKNFTSIDEICDPFSTLVGTIFKDYPYVLKNDSNDLRTALYKLGYSLGKWIYLIDALDDLKDDMKKNKFNPIDFLYNKNGVPYIELINLVKPKIEFLILSCACCCNDNLSKLILYKNEDILKNTLELGLVHKYNLVINNLDCESNKD